MQNYQDLVLKLYDILKSFTKESFELKEETDLIADLGLDSIKVIELLVMIEDSFDISIPLNILPDIRTINDLAEQLQQLLLEE